MPEIIIVPSREEAGKLVADAIVDLVAAKPDAVLGLATGSTPLPVYEAVAARVAAERLDLAGVRGFALDEYIGLPEDHPECYRSVVTREVVEPLGLTPALVRVPTSHPDHLHTAGAEYEQAIDDAGGIDLQLLGIGTVGHIGFNEPGSSLASLTRVKTLAVQTRIDNARFFDSLDDVPTHAITQGLGTILRARHLVLLAFGESKAAAIAAGIEGPISSSHPSSVIQLHQRATVILDEAAASHLKNIDYYRYAWANKPAWQGL